MPSVSLWFKILFFCCIALTDPALALEPPSAMSSGLPEEVTIKSREAADFILKVETGKWMNGPSFADGTQKWYLSARVTDVVRKPDGGINPFAPGNMILILPYCSRGTVPAPGGPGSACAQMVEKNMQIWALKADTRGRRQPSGNILVQIENLLDAAFID